MNSKKILLSFIVMIFVLTIPALTHASIKQQVKDVFGIVSTSDYLTRFYVLRQMEETLARIQELNKSIIQQEKNIAGSSAKTKAELEKTIADAETALQSLRNEILKQSELKLKDLNERIKSRQGKIEALTEGQKQESSLSRWANTADYWTFGYTTRATNVVRQWDQSNVDNLQAQITARRKSITQLEADIIKEQQATKDIFTSPEYKAKVEEINKKLQEAKTALTTIESKAAKLRQELIFSKNPEADKLIATLKQQINEAKCDAITDIASAKANTIAECKKQNLAKANKAMTIEVCKTLTIDSPPTKIDECIKTYRAKK